MEFLFRMIFLVVGYFIGSIGLSQIFIIMIFSKRFTKRLSKYGLLLDAHLISKRENATFLFWVIVLPLVTLAIYWFVSIGTFVFYLWGVLISFILGFRMYGATVANKTEYLTNNVKFIKFDAVDNIDDDIWLKEKIDELGAQYFIYRAMEDN